MTPNPMPASAASAAGCDTRDVTESSPNSTGGDGVIQPPALLERIAELEKAFQRECDNGADARRLRELHQALVELGA